MSTTKEQKKRRKELAKRYSKRNRKIVIKRNLWRVPLAGIITYLTMPLTNGLIFDMPDLTWGYLVSFPIIFTIFRLWDGDNIFVNLIMMIKLGFFALFPGIITAIVFIFSPELSFMAYLVCCYIILVIENDVPIKGNKDDYEGRSNAEFQQMQERGEYQSRIWEAEHELDRVKKYGHESEVQHAEHELYERESEMTDYERKQRH